MEQAIYVSKGVRINENTLTVDMPQNKAEMIRKALILAHAGLKETLDNEHLKAVREFCDNIAGPLGSSTNRS